MSRTRTRTSTPVAGGSITIGGKRYNGTGSPPTNISATTSFSGDVQNESITDVVSPNFKRRIAAGEIINNNYQCGVVLMETPKPTSYNRALLSIANGKVSGDTWSGSWPISSTELGGFLSTNSDYQSSLDTAISQAVTQAYADTSQAEILALTTAAEMRKTVDGLIAIFVRAIRLFRAVRKFDLKYIKREISMKELSDRYMELRYALRPLAYDAAGIVKVLKKDRTTHQRVTGRGQSGSSWEISDVLNRNDGNFIMSINRKARIDFSVRAGVLCSADITECNIQGLDQIALSAWEIVPFSFILDWFWNIGNTIAALSPKTGVTKLASWYTVELTVVLENTLGTIANASNPNYQSSISWSGRKAQYERWKTRTINPTPGYLPTSNIRLDFWKLLDMAKIMGQLRK